MKQKKLGDILYVFDTTPYIITEDTDADVIKVQLESYDGFIELNESLAEKIVKYNYKLFTVKQLEWGPYINEPDPTPVVKYNITFTNDSDAGADVEIDPTEQEEGSMVYIRFLNSQSSSTIDITSEDVQLTYDSNMDEYYFAMPAQDVEIKAVYSTPVVTGHTLTLDGQNIHANVTVYFDAVQQQVEYQYSDIAENVAIDIYPTQSVANYTLVSGATWDTDHWTATMPDQDLTITINYAEPVIETAEIEISQTQGSADIGTTDRIMVEYNGQSHWFHEYMNSGTGYETTMMADIPVGAKVFWMQTSNYTFAISPSVTDIQTDFGTKPGFVVSTDVTYMYYATAIPKPSLTVTYDIDDTSNEIQIWDGVGESGSSETPLSVPDKMYVDGVEETPASTWRFSTTGIHTIVYEFNDGLIDIQFMSIPSMQSYVADENITSIWSNCWRASTGESDGIDQTYLATTPPTIIENYTINEPLATVYVPAASVTAYQAATRWSNISGNIQAIVNP